MKKVFIGILVLLAVVAMGADVTQTATYTTKRPPRTNDKFYTKTADAVYNLVNTDIPAIITNINGDKAVTGNLTVTSNATVNGSTTLNEDVAVNFNANDEEILVTITNTSANPVRVLGNDANPGSSTLLTLDLTADGDADAEYIICRDNASTDTKFKVDADGATTVGSLSTGTGEATIDGKYAVVGKDATTPYMVLAASVTSTAATLQTNTFATAFGATPVVTVSYTEDPGGAEAPWIVSVNTTTLVVTTIADKNYSYIAVGQRP